MFAHLSGLISRALPRDSLHGDSKERPLIAGSIMQGNALTCRNKLFECWHKSEISLFLLFQAHLELLQRAMKKP